MSFIQKLNQSVEALKKDPNVEVVYYKVFEPNLDAIKKVEEELGYSLDPSLRSFYEECGGVQLLWGQKDDDEFEHRRDFVNKVVSEEGGLDYSSLFIGDNHLAECETRGVIMIPPIDTVFLDRDFNADVIDADIEVDDLDIDEDSTTYRILEWFSNSRNLIFILDGSPNPKIVSGGFGEYDGETFTTFDKYLDRLLLTRGDNSQRRLADNDDGDDGDDE